MNVPTPNYAYPKCDTPSAYLIGRGSHLGMENGAVIETMNTMNSMHSMHSMNTTNTTNTMNKGGVAEGSGIQLNFEGGSSMLNGRSSMGSTTMGSTTMGSSTMGSTTGTTTEHVVQSAMAASAVAASRSIPLVPSPYGGGHGGGLLAPRDPSSPSFRSIHQQHHQHHQHQPTQRTTFQSPSGGLGGDFNGDFNDDFNGDFDGGARGGGTLHHLSQVSALGATTASTTSLMQDLSMQRDASNDIIPLPGHRDINDGRIPLSSGVGPEHTREAVQQANARHHDVTRAMLHASGGGRGGGRGLWTSGGGRGPTTLDVIEWVQGMKVPLMRPHDLETNVAPEFSNGVKLCLLVQKCELMRGALPGVNAEPKNQAQASATCFLLCNRLF